jgi:glycosyltransferase involved in cell wall biosynthesis
MRALLVNHSSSETELGGAERSLLALGEAWVARDASVRLDVVTASAEGLFAQSIRDRAWDLFAVPFWPWAIPQLNDSAEARYHNSLRDDAAVLAILRRIRETQPDVVVTNSVVNPWGAVAAAIAGTPHVWFAREYGDLDHGLQFTIGTRESWEDVGFLSDLVVANSEAIRAHAAGYLPGREILVAYPSIDLDGANAVAPATAKPRATKAQGAQKPLSIVMVGTVGPAKQQHLAVEALARLRDKGTAATLTLVGPHDHPDYLTTVIESAERLGVADEVRLEGYQADPSTFVEAADVALMLSRSEAFGRVTLEYLASGTPVVGIDAGGTPELIADGHSGFVVAGEPDAIAGALARYAADPALVAAHSAAAPADADEIARRHPLSAVLTAIEELVSSYDGHRKLPHLAEHWLSFAPAAGWMVAARESQHTAVVNRLQQSQRETIEQQQRQSNQSLAAVESRFEAQYAPIRGFYDYARRHRILALPLRARRALGRRWRRGA